jgi:hypothetical protein
MMMALAKPHFAQNAELIQLLAHGQRMLSRENI